MAEAGFPPHTMAMRRILLTIALAAAASGQARAQVIVLAKAEDKAKFAPKATCFERECLALAAQNPEAPFDFKSGGLSQEQTERAGGLIVAAKSGRVYPDDFVGPLPNGGCIVSVCNLGDFSMEGMLAWSKENNKSIVFTGLPDDVSLKLNQDLAAAHAKESGDPLAPGKTAFDGANTIDEMYKQNPNAVKDERTGTWVVFDDEGKFQYACAIDACLNDSPFSPSELTALAAKRPAALEAANKTAGKTGGTDFGALGAGIGGGLGAGGETSSDSQTDGTATTENAGGKGKKAANPDGAPPSEIAKQAIDAAADGHDVLAMLDAEQSRGVDITKSARTAQTALTEAGTVGASAADSAAAALGTAGGGKTAFGHMADGSDSQKPSDEQVGDGKVKSDDSLQADKTRALQGR